LLRYHKITIGDVNERAREAFNAWKQADAQARSAETRLALAWEGYFSRRAEPPSRELVGEVSVLRGVANDRLSVAMQALGGKRSESASSGTKSSERPSA
jgi:ferric-dicitrate binding protein FerR (iron transport regulator)